jgi:hypothetical protein
VPYPIVGELGTHPRQDLHLSESFLYPVQSGGDMPHPPHPTSCDNREELEAVHFFEPWQVFGQKRIRHNLLQILEVLSGAACMN